MKQARFIAVALMLTGVALGDAPPATLPATVPVDQSTPRGALKVLSQAMNAGDEKTILQSVHTANDTELQMLQALAGLARSMAGMRSAAVEAFGRDGAIPLTGHPDAAEEDLARIDAANESLEGERATVTIDTVGAPPAMLQRIEGKWKIVLGELIRGDELPQQTTKIAAISRAYDQAAEQIAAGKYRTAQEAAQALLSATIATPPATTAPASK